MLSFLICIWTQKGGKVRSIFFPIRSIKLQVPLSKDKGTTNPRTCPPGKTGSKRRRRKRKIKKRIECCK
jgi:hypothetical protein